MKALTIQMNKQNKGVPVLHNVLINMHYALGNDPEIPCTQNKCSNKYQTHFLEKMTFFNWQGQHLDHAPSHGCFTILVS